MESVEELGLELVACEESPDVPDAGPASWANRSEQSNAHKSPMAGKVHPVRENDFRRVPGFCMNPDMILLKAQDLNSILPEFHLLQSNDWSSIG